jgi:cytochrome c553
VPACFSCHGPAGFGVAPEFPALAAQHAPYTAMQLAAWAGGTRSNAPLGLMANISAALSSGDRRAVADYMASLPPVPAGSVTNTPEENRDAN